MGNSQIKKMAVTSIKESLPSQWRTLIEQICKCYAPHSVVTDQELQLIFQLFDDLRVRSNNYMGIDRDVFVRFCPIPVSKLETNSLGAVGSQDFQKHFDCGWRGFH
jgi:hypothetical protein